MAEPGDKWYDNLEIKTLINGDVYSFYCDHACIHCFVCHENAPNHFESSKDGDHSRVYDQPKTEEEREEFGEVRFSDQSRNIAKEYIDQTRERKGLSSNKKIIVDAEKQRTLTRNK